MDAVLLILKTLRVRRWYINAFVVAGSLLAIRFFGSDAAVAGRIIFAVVIACIISSANYALNEVLDAESDSHHIEKKDRPIPSGKVGKTAILLLSFGLYAVAIGIAFSTHSTAFVLACSALIISGFLYNIPPLRLKDIAFLDFISEAINNPIRLLIGWYAVSSAVFPSSLFISLWSFAIFLMAAKRFAEFRFITDRDEAVRYRKSFKYYTEQKLLLAMVGAICAFMYMMGILTMRYEKNLVFSLPLFIIFIVWLCAIAYQRHSFIKDPEHILSNKYFLVYLFVLILVVVGLIILPRTILTF